MSCLCLSRVASVGAAPAQASDVIQLRNDGALAVRVAEPLPLAALVGEIATAIGAQLLVRRDPGMVGPVDLDGLPVREVLTRLAGRHSLALRYRRGAIVAIVLVAATEETDRSPRRVVALARAGALPLPSFPAMEAANRQAVAIREVIGLSYRRNAAAIAELRRLASGSDDGVVRAAAISALAGMAVTGAAAAVDRGLVDPDPQVRQRAVQSLWSLDGTKAAVRLRALAATDKNAAVRAEAERLLTDAALPADRPAGGPTAPRCTLSRGGMQHQEMTRLVPARVNAEEREKLLQH